MNREHKKSMWLNEPDFTGMQILSELIPSLIAAMTYVVLTITITKITGFGEIYNPALAIVGGVFICLICGSMEILRLKRWFVPGMLAVLLLLLITCRAWLADGFRLFWNQMAVTWTSGRGLVLKEWQVYFPEQRELCLALFSLAWAVTAGMAFCVVSQWKPVLLAALLPMATLLGAILFRTQEPLDMVSAAFLAGCFAFLGNGWTGKTKTSTLFSWILCGAAALLVLVVVSTPGIANWADTYSSAFRQGIHERKYETQYTTLPEGDLKAVMEDSSTDQPALIVSMSTPEVMYLRGFTGTTFDGIRWTEQDTAVLAQNRELLYWINQHEFNPLSQFEKALLDWEYEENQITVQNIGACSQYRYVPYQLCQAYLSPEDLRTDSFYAEGERIYFYSTILKADTLLWPLLKDLQNNEQQVTMEYRKAESAYRSYVDAYYLDIPEEVLAVMGTIWDAAADTYGGRENLTPQTAQFCVKDVLEQIAAEDTLYWQTQLPAAGTVFQDATVAVLTMRYFGLPARYAEGYVISEEMIHAANGNTTFQVGSQCATAWAEVYQDGIGWIPADLTLGAADDVEEPQPEESQSSQESDSSNGFGGVDEENGNGFIKEGQELEELQEQNEQLEQEEQQQEFSIQLPENFLKILVGVLLGLLLMVLIIVIRYWLLCRKKEKKFRDDQVNDAVAWVFADTAVILASLGFQRGNGSMTSLSQPVSQRLGQEYSREMDEMIRLNARAMFSSKVLTEEQRTQMLQFRLKTIKQLKLHTKWYRSLWLKWIRCLY